MGHTTVRLRRNGDEELVDAVDQSLYELAGRDFVTYSEAVRLLGDVRTSARSTTYEPTLTGIVNDALAALAGRALIDRSSVVDPLLDLRLVLTG